MALKGKEKLSYKKEIDIEIRNKLFEMDVSVLQFKETIQ